MTRAMVLSLAVCAMSATSYGAEQLNEAAKDADQTYTYVVGMSGVT